MSFATLLIHEADIKRYTPDGGEDAYGQPTGAWGDIYADEPCRIMSTTGREIKVGAEVVISDWKLFVDDSVIITEQDRLDNIRLRATGAVIDTSTYEFLLVQPRSNGTDLHHLEVAMQKVD